MNSIKKNSKKKLSAGLTSFEDGRNAVKSSDYTDLKTFVKDYLNTPEPKQRKKLADEFLKRHMELYEFLKNNAELVSAETDIARMIKSAVGGEELPKDNKELTNLLEMIGGSLG